MGQIASGERGTLVTMCCCINALGQALPPVYIFPRVNFKSLMLHGAPEQSLGLANSSGYMTKECFPKVLAHFMKHMNISPTNPGLLLMDNHSSHRTIEAVDMAKENSLFVLTFPPHCSHKLQPLDVCVYGPFKTFYQSYARDWMLNNPGQGITIYQVAQLSAGVFAKAFSMTNILAGFRCTGIFPINCNVFAESEFMPASVTDRPVMHAAVDDQHCAAALIVEAPTNVPSMEATVPTANSCISEHDSSTLSQSPQPRNVEDDDILTSLCPLPKRKLSACKRKKFPNHRKKVHASVLTDTPEKEQLPSAVPGSAKRKTITPKRKKVCKKVVFTSSSETEDGNLSLHNTSDECSLSSENEGSNFGNENSVAPELDKYVVVRVKSKLGSKNYIAIITDGPDSDDDYEIKFMKRSQKIRNGFVASGEELASVHSSDILVTLPRPSPVASTKRLSGVLKFCSANVQFYNVV